MREYVWAPIVRKIGFALFLSCLLLPGTLFAQSSNKPTGTHKEDSVEQLRDQLQRIEEHHQRELADLLWRSKVSMTDVRPMTATSRC
jgi:hypothetical protein